MRPLADQRRLATDHQ